MFKPVLLTLTEKQRSLLQTWSRSRSQSHQLVDRAKLILYIVDSGNKSNLKVKAELGRPQKWVKHWRNRWALHQAALASQEASLSEKAYEQALQQALADAPRSGAPLRYSVEQQCQLYELACQNPKQLGYPLSHWDSKSLRLALIKKGIVSDISVSTVARFLKKRGT